MFFSEGPDFGYPEGVVSCDADKSFIRLSYVTHFYLNQKDVSAITSLLRRYEAYSPSLLDRIQFVVVDDGSPLTYEIPDFNLNIIWLRIDRDIAWNQAGARNLGVVYAKSDKLLITDLDHEFPENTLMHMIDRRECGKNMYRIYRTNPKRRPHPNTFLLSRARFLRFYGYDEEFAGHYGAEDYRFVKFQKYNGTRFLKLPGRYTCFERRDIDRGSAYHSLKRDLTRNSPIDKRKHSEILAYGPDAGHSRMFLNFTWRIVLNHCREVRINRKKNRLWKRLWHWRWLLPW